MPETKKLTDELPPAASGLASPVVSQTLLKVAAGIVALAVAVVGLQLTNPELVATLPPVIFTVAKGIVALGTLLGLVSPGLRKPTATAEAAGKEAEKDPSKTLDK